MSDAQRWGRQGGLERAARYSKDEVRAITRNARLANERHIEEWAIREYNLDPKAEDYQERLGRARSRYYSRIRRGEKVA